jgi:hypothetical protein
MAFIGPAWRDSDAGAPGAETPDDRVPGDGVCMPFMLFEHIFEYKGIL